MRNEQGPEKTQKLLIWNDNFRFVRAGAVRYREVVGSQDAPRNIIQNGIRSCVQMLFGDVRKFFESLVNYLLSMVLRLRWRLSPRPAA